MVEIEDVLDQALSDVLEDQSDDIVHRIVLEDSVEDFDRLVDLIFKVRVEPNRFVALTLADVPFLILEPLQDALVGFDATLDSGVCLQHIGFDVIKVGDEPSEELLVGGEVSVGQGQ